MPFLDDSSKLDDGVNSLIPQTASEEENLSRRQKEAKTDGDDSIMHSYSSKESLKSNPGEERPDRPGIKKTMTPLQLFSYSISPENKYIGTRSYGASTAEEKVSS